MPGQIHDDRPEGAGEDVGVAAPGPAVTGEPVEEEQGLAADQIARLSALGERAYRTSRLVAHYEDLRALLSSWRYFHRWVAWLMVLLASTHITAALRFARILP